MGCSYSHNEATVNKVRTLHVIVPHANPCKYRRRSVLYHQTYRHLRQLQVQLAQSSTTERLAIHSISVEYSTQVLLPTVWHATPYDHDNTWETIAVPPQQVLWSKENLINIGIERLCTLGARYIAWVDADIMFNSVAWVKDTMDVIDTMTCSGSGKRGAFVQLFDTAVLLDKDDKPMHVTKSFGAQYVARKSYVSVANNAAEYWHPGFAWAADGDTLRMLAACTGASLIERTLGGADRHMAMALIRRAAESVPSGMSDDYKSMVCKWQDAALDYKVGLGVVPGVIRHFWHGTLENRKYVERWDILHRHGFKPSAHMYRQVAIGGGNAAPTLLQWTPVAPSNLLRDVANYFWERDEDDMYRMRLAEPQVEVKDKVVDDCVWRDRLVEDGPVGEKETKFYLYMPETKQYTPTMPCLDGDGKPIITGYKDVPQPDGTTKRVPQYKMRWVGPQDAKKYSLITPVVAKAQTKSQPQRGQDTEPCRESCVGTPELYQTILPAVVDMYMSAPC